MKFLEAWGVTQATHHWIFVLIRITICIQEILNRVFTTFALFEDFQLFV